MASALPTLSKVSVRPIAPHDLNSMHHPSIFPPAKPNVVPANKCNVQQSGIQGRPRITQNMHNGHSRYNSNMILPPLESISSNENLPNLDNKQYQKVHAPLVNTQQSIQSGQQFHQQYNESRYDDGNEADEENDAYLESRYSDDGEEPKTCGEEEYDDEGGEELDADPSEFGVTVTKL